MAVKPEHGSTSNATLVPPAYQRRQGLGFVLIEFGCVSLFQHLQIEVKWSDQQMTFSFDEYIQGF
uniref:Uncharacterized protein n=1 Tax=Moniliophthora roreri TaxID=221103 RepID=A0A0W0FBX8_MONRR